VTTVSYLKILAASSSRRQSPSDGFSPAERTGLVVTTGLALWNMGAAYLAGLALHHAWKRRLTKL
jgi:hypothetical protein